MLIGSLSIQKTLKIFFLYFILCELTVHRWDQTILLTPLYILSVFSIGQIPG